MEQSLIQAFQQVLAKWTFKSPSSFPEEFAQRRFLKKFEVPGTSDKDLTQLCWDRFLSNDVHLPTNLVRPSGHWYKARHKIHQWLASFNLSDDIGFPNGGSQMPTRARNSIASYLKKNEWTCTADNFEQFCSLVYSHAALKRAFRKRYQKWFAETFIGFETGECDKYLYERFDTPFQIFRWKLERVVKIVHGSRFATVPKNNDNERPINIEPFGNLLVQKRIGDGIREVLKGQNLDLDNTALLHRALIRDSKYATIDLKDASDSVSVALCQFLLPHWFFSSLMNSRSYMLLGHDGDYHTLRKISSMGNGFTFELMTMILYALCQCLDADSSVFGDDIIINKTAATHVIELLEEVGFKVNLQKSFIDGPFRESCGANYHDDFGYIKSYDFYWPENIHDCIVVFNKVADLSEIYPSFERLRSSLITHIPSVLRGGSTQLRVERDFSGNTDEILSDCFRCGDLSVKGLRLLEGRYSYIVRRNLHISGQIRFHYGYEWVPRLAQPCRNKLRNSNWDLYLMYLFSTRVSKDIITGEGVWVRKVFVSYNGLSTRFNPRSLIES